jgi:hypothetical protein
MADDAVTAMCCSFLVFQVPNDISILNQLITDCYSLFSVSILSQLITDCYSFPLHLLAQMLGGDPLQCHSHWSGSPFSVRGDLTQFIQCDFQSSPA